MLPGHTRYAVMIVIFFVFLPSSVIQLHRPRWSDPHFSIRPLSLLDTPVIVPPGLYLLGNNSGDVDNCTFAWVSFIFNVDITSCFICGHDMLRLTSWMP